VNNYYWQIADGRIWSGERGAWIEPADIPAGAMVTKLFNGGQPSGIDYLKTTILFYGRDLGELAAKLERIAAVQEKCRPALAELNAAYLSARMDGDEETAAEIADEKRELRATMAAEIKAIQEEK